MTNRAGRRTVIATLVAAAAAGVAGALAYQRQGSSSVDPRPLATQLFYDQNLRDAAGVAHAMSEHRGRAVLVNFWATWCVPCVKEIPSFSKIHAETGGDVAFVGLGIDSPDNIARFNERIRPSYPLLAAGAGGTDLVRAFGDESGALPFTVLIGPDGRVVASHLGQVDESTLRRWIGPFLGRSEPVRPPPSS
jgi:thiol-disulfide isomerase/thioredoxin